MLDIIQAFQAAARVAVKQCNRRRGAPQAPSDSSEDEKTNKQAGGPSGQQIAKGKRVESLVLSPIEVDHQQSITPLDEAIPDQYPMEVEHQQDIVPEDESTQKQYPIEVDQQQDIATADDSPQGQHQLQRSSIIDRRISPP